MARHHAKKVDIEKALDIACFGKFHRAGNAKPGIIDEDIDAAVFIQHLGHGGFYLLLIGDIASQVGNALYFTVPAAQLVDLAAAVPQGGRGAQPYAAAAPGDNDYFTHTFSPSTPPMISTASSMSGSVRVAM